MSKKKTEIVKNKIEKIDINNLIEYNHLDNVQLQGDSIFVEFLTETHKASKIITSSSDIEKKDKILLTDIALVVKCPEKVFTVDSAGNQIPIDVQVGDTVITKGVDLNPAVTAWAGKGESLVTNQGCQLYTFYGTDLIPNKPTAFIRGYQIIGVIR